MTRRQNWRDLTVATLAALASCVVLLWLVGCFSGPQSDQQIKQQAAQTTEQVKAGAKKAAAEAKIAAANAKRDATDIAAGIREGMRNKQSNDSSESEVDINSASTARLMTLPGISAARARRIIRNRPYDAPRDLVRKGVLSGAEYSRISSQIVARHL